MWKSIVSNTQIICELKSGLSLLEIQHKYHLGRSWHYQARAKRLQARAKKEEREQRLLIAHPVTIYHMSAEEVEKRYGKCGEMVEKKEYTFIPRTERTRT